MVHPQLQVLGLPELLGKLIEAAVDASREPPVRVLFIIPAALYRCSQVLHAIDAVKFFLIS